LILYAWATPLWPRAVLYPAFSSRSRSFLACNAGWAPHVAFAFAQQMPDEHRELTGGRDSGDMLTAAGADSQEERTQRTRRSRCRPSRLDEHAARMPMALLGLSAHSLSTPARTFVLPAPRVPDGRTISPVPFREQPGRRGADYLIPDNGQVERMNRTIKDATVKRCFY
jgi:hypothetical protein